MGPVDNIGGWLSGPRCGCNRVEFGLRRCRGRRQCGDARAATRVSTATDFSFRCLWNLSFRCLWKCRGRCFHGGLPGIFPDEECHKTRPNVGSSCCEKWHSEQALGSVWFTGLGIGLFLVLAHGQNQARCAACRNMDEPRGYTVGRCVYLMVLRLRIAPIHN